MTRGACLRTVALAALAFFIGTPVFAQVPATETTDGEPGPATKNAECLGVPTAVGEQSLSDLDDIVERAATERPRRMWSAPRAVDRQAELREWRKRCPQGTSPDFVGPDKYCVRPDGTRHGPFRELNPGFDPWHGAADPRYPGNMQFISGWYIDGERWEDYDLQNLEARYRLVVGSVISRSELDEMIAKQQRALDAISGM